MNVVTTYSILGDKISWSWFDIFVASCLSSKTLLQILLCSIFHC